MVLSSVLCVYFSI
uniref:Uncharacterized protein n=1 Tax=Rhizophora mucronata TaxID=61149 RepID=A0A2P2N7U0_RHIMU